MDVKTFFLGLVLVPMPFITLFMCGVVGAWLAKDCHSHLAVFSEVILGLLSFLPIVQIYEYTSWSFSCALSGFFNGLVVVGGFYMGLGILSPSC
ncbi:iron transporter [Helicobacter salomonis]|uniref:iron transporter n=1 Tax=Helicobacter salomonis TaxID=56878 RepID=UPI001F3B3C8A|nr:iron transporter [Helicobacter salomonis]